ncbi:CRISPR-associated protein Cas5 [Agathobaculum sp.]|uniref:CRISPR-associated protein Cas5 n=1 Tax=Agathobaculum sp. TaxID=2048138 RepID=UPI003AB37DF8
MKEIVIEVWGDLACFTMPYAKVERLTYPFPTPSAARGILSAIYSKPKEFRWQINRIEVLNPIRYISFKSYWLLRRTTPALRRLMISAVRRFRQAQVAPMRSLWRATIRSTQTTRSTSSTPMQMLPLR